MHETEDDSAVDSLACTVAVSLVENAWLPEKASPAIIASPSLTVEESTAEAMLSDA
jgi:hypothetical protein